MLIDIISFPLYASDKDICKGVCVCEWVRKVKAALDKVVDF